MARKFFISLFVLAAALFVFTGVQNSYAASELDRMNIFLSNFTEVSMFDFDVDDGENDEIIHLGNPENVGQLVYFGVAHNFLNNRKSTIKKCTDKNCPYEFKISKAAVASSVEKYFNLKLGKVKKGELENGISFDGKDFHFDAPVSKDDVIYYVDIDDVDKEGKFITMTGEIYNVKNKKERPATFTALAMPHTWNNKKTWAILEFKVEWKGEE